MLLLPSRLCQSFCQNITKPLFITVISSKSRSTFKYLNHIQNCKHSLFTLSTLFWFLIAFSPSKTFHLKIQLLLDAIKISFAFPANLNLANIDYVFKFESRKLMSHYILKSTLFIVRKVFIVKFFPFLIPFLTFFFLLLIRFLCLSSLNLIANCHYSFNASFVFFVHFSFITLTPVFTKFSTTPCLKNDCFPKN